MLILLVAGLGQRVSPAEAITLKIDSPKAIEIAKKIFVGFGAKNKVAIDEIRLTKHYTNKERPFWAIGAIDARNRRYSASIDASDGRLISFGSGDSELPVSKKVDVSKDRLESMAFSFLKKVSTDRQVRLDQCQAQNDQKYFAAFDILLGGRRFFNVNPAFKYHLIFYPGEKRVRTLNAYDRLPLPPTLAPSISKERAIEALEIDMLASQDWNEAQSFNPRNGPMKYRMDAELGLYKWPNESTARFVWHVTGTMYQTSQGHDFSYKRYSRVVDAVTGKVYPILDKDGVF